MKLSDVITAVRRKVGEEDSTNSRWTDAQIRDTVDAVKRRIHRNIADVLPELFRFTVDVTLPADTYEVAIPWAFRGAPQVLHPIYDITDSSTPGSEMVVVPRYLETEMDGVGVEGTTFYTTSTFSTARTFRLIVVRPSIALQANEDEPEDIPEDYQYDLLVYGTAIDLQDESLEIADIPEIWRVKYEQAEKDMHKFFRRQVRFQSPRYGERYHLSTWGLARGRYE